MSWSALGFARSPLVLLTDFGTQDGAVSAMKGVAYGVSPDLLVEPESEQTISRRSFGYLNEHITQGAHAPNTFSRLGPPVGLGSVE